MTEEHPEEPPVPKVDWSDIPSPAKPHYWWRLLLIGAAVIVMILVVPVIINLGQQRGWWTGLSLLKVSTEPKQVISVIGRSESGVLLIVDRRDARQISFVLPDTLQPLELSQGLANNAQPILAFQGDRVAFVVGELGKREIKLAPIHGTISILISDTQIGEFGNTNGLSGLCICKENALSWSPDGTFLAFFACTQEESVLMTVDTNAKILYRVPNTNDASNRPRSLAWLDNSRILFVEQASPDADQAFVINTDGTKKTPVFFAP